MKIGFFGDGIWAKKTLELLLSQSKMRVVFVGLRTRTSHPSLEEIAVSNAIPLFVPVRVNSRESIAFLEEHAPDLIVSMSYNQIFGRRLLSIFPNRIINCHAGALPKYRGRNVLNWAIINGEKNFGVTVHYVDNGIDTGDVLSQVVCKIEEYDDYRSVLQKAEELCSKLLFQVILDYGNGFQSSFKQNGAGSYFRKRVYGDEFIDWNKSACQIANLIRGITLPGPCALAFLGSYEYKFVACFVEEHPHSEATRKPGQVVDVCAGRIYIATLDDVLVITAFKAPELAPAIKIGDIFCT
jgi:methionyl-tRNA formyltransferase